ncbi:hypothetical protein WJX74_003317 [Apatococcus lobatus]|uniref:Fibronectin type-III domain-containing protein n=1 Tax=Apatococcus lobatus TaxID=904363 RepID=A0AAW1RVP7_9CHLO
MTLHVHLLQTDILDHKESQAKAAERRCAALEDEVITLKEELHEATERATKLFEETSEQALQIEAAQEFKAQLQQLQDTIKKQDAVVLAQKGEIQSLSDELQTVQTEVKSSHTRIADLTLKTQGGKTLLMLGGEGKGSQGERELAALNLDTLGWQSANMARAAEGVAGHSATPIQRNKILVYGGTRAAGLTHEVVLLYTDTLKWVSLNPRGSIKPCVRQYHAATCLLDKVFVFGGQSQEGHLLNDLWQWDLEALQWVQIMYIHTIGGANTAPPSPRRGASLVVSEDGRKLWIFGGNSGHGSLNDLYSFDIESCMWCQVSVVGVVPEARELHAAAMVGRYLVVSKGIMDTGQNNGRTLVDTLALDTSSPSWETLDDGHWASSFALTKPRAAISAFCGNRLYSIRHNRNERVDELQILEFTLPEDIERMQSERKRLNVASESLAISGEAACTSSSITITWSPPTKNADRISNFKVMVATTYGVVKTVYIGPKQQCLVASLKPSQEYVFSVKALYDDGSFLWSESQSFSTRA